ncbi:glycosyltransferase family 8 protein [Rhodovulum sp. YNF3179]|uniref:glycosyltransferase family 8 protein n=1 Tax=Rhodovulum sp. YNF3179 TaxID=3425127 RepID=UPI003D327F88
MSQTAPRHRSAVALACNDAYAPYAFFVADQIARLHPERSFDICIAMPDPPAPPASLARHDIRLLRFADGNPFDDGPNPGRHGGAAYLRLVLPDLLARDYDRMLYLDSDVFVTSGGLDQLLQMDLGPHPVGAVRDNLQWRTPDRQVPEFRKMGLGRAPYFNSGVLLIDIPRFRAESVLDRCLETFAMHPEALPRHDQSLLNIVLHGGWAELSPVWNWQYTWSSRFFADLVAPKILHFIGTVKPWRDRKRRLPERYRAPYAAFLAETYPDRPDLALPSPDGPAALDEMGPSFLKHWQSLGAMRRYLGRFTSPYARAEGERQALRRS